MAATSKFRRSFRKFGLGESLLVESILLCAAGFALQNGNLPLGSLALSAGIFAAFVGCYAAEIQWGNPGIPRKLQPVAIVWSVVFWYGPLSVIVATRMMDFETAKTIAVLAAQPFVLFVPFGLRGSALWPPCCCTLLLSIYLAAIDEPGDVPLLIMCTLGFAFGSWTQYIRDQRMVVGIFWIGAGAGNVGKSTADDNAVLFIWGAIVLSVFIYWLLLANRMRRRLPANLKGAKFVRLGYLREMQTKGQKITRMQQMPPAAFGDPGKSTYLVITSHRWLDRFTCDVATGDCPHGLRLTTMVARLGTFFPEAVVCTGSFVSMLSLTYKGMMAGSSDVLTFFDFMSLPQLGLDDAGDIIDRTAEEKLVFIECLPAMGSLYSIYPVMVLREVTDGSHPYEESGWCFSEFMTAYLGKQLSMYSFEAVKDWEERSSKKEGARFRRQDSLDSIGASALLRDVQIELQRKRFFAEADRQVVLDIVKMFTTKRVLVDAILANNAPEVKRILQTADEVGRQGLLDEPVDKQLRTVLHVAVQTGCLEAVGALIDSGADANVRDLRGDTPAQWLLFPRLSRAARLCSQASAKAAARAHEAEKSENVQTEELPAESSASLPKPTSHGLDVDAPKLDETKETLDKLGKAKPLVDLMV